MNRGQLEQRLLVLITLGLVAFGLVMVYSATSAAAALGNGDPVTFLKRQGIFDRCIFHLSDEPGEKHVAQYRAVRELVRAIAPQIRVTEALSDVEFLKENLVDQPVPVIDKLPGFLRVGTKPWVYYCCNPQGSYPNRFLDYPLYRLQGVAGEI